MSILVQSLKRLYLKGRLTKADINVRVGKGTIDEAQYELIVGAPYKAE